MNHALDTIATGLDAAQTMMDTISDNLSNVNTTGFKSETPEFQSLLYQNGIQPGAQSTGQTVYPSGLEVGTGVKVAAIKDTMTQGTLAQTGNPYDMAINGTGYFQILQPNGQTVYSVTIGTDGTVSITTPGSQVATQVGQIQIASFVNPQGLQPLGGNLFAATTASGAATAGAPQTNGLGSTNQNYLEGSNVDVVSAMVTMISAERAYQLGTQVASAVDNQLNYLAQAAAGA
jgi:flagellar basal-body rod protein FlgG